MVAERAGVEPDEAEDLSRWALVGLVLAVVAGAVVATWSLLTWVGGCPSSGGQDTGIAGDSMRSSLCEGGPGVAVLASMPLGWLAGSVLAGLALVRWRGGVRGALLLAVIVLAPSALPAGTYALLSRSSTSCGDEELSAYREWVDAGARGQSPHDCRTS